MFQQFNISRSGFGMYQKMMFNITNNIANAQTPGFKQSRLEIAAIFPQVMSEAEAQYIKDEDYNPYARKKRGIELGMGVQIEAITKDFSQGKLQLDTGYQYDMAIQGKGFFQFKLNDGRIAYGRAGNLDRYIDGLLRNPTGYALEPPISIPEDASQVTIDQEGRVFVNINDEKVPVEVGQILLARFANPNGLKDIGNNIYVETVESGEPKIDVPGRNNVGSVIQYAKEASNVDVVREMMDMIMAQKGLELLGKAMGAGEKMLNAGMGLTGQ